MINECRFVGRLSASAAERTFPSGDVVAIFRLIVPREEVGRVDALDCRVEAAGVRKRVMALETGASIEVQGSLHRRFWRSAQGPASKYEVLVRSMRKVTVE